MTENACFMRAEEENQTDMSEENLNKSRSSNIHKKKKQIQYGSHKYNGTNSKL